ncbi:MAG: hypothetical protein WA993_09520 [Candidatus Binatus sp.]|jgi:hypothetical protein
MGKGKAMQMHMWRLRMIAAAVLVLVVSGCGKSNPLIGKWKLAPGPNCKLEGGQLEFTEKTMTDGSGTYVVTYDRDGEFYLVKGNAGFGDMVTRFKVESGGIAEDKDRCHYVPEDTAASVLSGDALGVSKQLAAAINEDIGKKKVCYRYGDNDAPTWPVEIDYSRVEDLPPILVDMQAAGYLHITQEQHPAASSANPNPRAFDLIAPTEQAKGWWVVPDGFCVGTRAVADIQRWTEPGEDSGKPIEVSYTWHLADVPSWANRPEFKNIEGMATEVKATAELQKTNNGWKTSGDDQ